MTGLNPLAQSASSLVARGLRFQVSCIPATEPQLARLELDDGATDQLACPSNCRGRTQFVAAGCRESPACSLALQDSCCLVLQDSGRMAFRRLDDAYCR